MAIAVDAVDASPLGQWAQVLEDSVTMIMMFLRWECQKINEKGNSPLFFMYFKFAKCNLCRLVVTGCQSLPQTVKIERGLW